VELDDLDELYWENSKAAARTATMAMAKIAFGESFISSPRSV
jgi:hypothetical protein